MLFVTVAYFLATLLIGGAQTLQDQVLPGLSFIVAGVFAFWAGSSLKLGVFAPAGPPRRVAFALAALFTAIALGATMATGVRFDAYGQDMPGAAWVIAGLIAGIMGTKKRRYIAAPPEAKA
jgi:ammonia channel protein AmtB